MTTAKVHKTQTPRRHLEIQVQEYAGHIGDELENLRKLYSLTRTQASRVFSGKKIAHTEMDQILRQRAEYDAAIQKSLIIIRGAAEKLAELNTRASRAVVERLESGE
ncbi:MAG: hypothetical protein OXU94_08105 [Gammaproteobacteria bacterium]|nr:hypothetical protein [Gammaproteobacteria bacterium]